MRRQRMLAGLLALILAAVALPQHAAAERVVHHSADPETRKIALTFDDGPHPSYTYRILDILDRYGVKATFFMIGSNVEYYPEVAKEVLRRGHEIGNHTYSHHRLTKMDGPTLTEEPPARGRGQRSREKLRRLSRIYRCSLERGYPRLGDQRNQRNRQPRHARGQARSNRAHARLHGAQ